MYIKVVNNEIVAYPYPIDLLKFYHPNVSFPEVLSNELLTSYGVYPVIEKPKPVVDKNKEYLEKAYPALIDGVWFVDWVVKEIVKTPEQIKKEITDETLYRLDSFAKTRNYDSILSACTYAASSVLQFAKEGQYCVNMRDATWGKLYQIMQEVEAGTRPMPTGYADIEAELPVLDWDNA